MQIIALYRLNKLYIKNIKNSRFAKHIKRYLLNIYNLLYLKNGFEFQIVDLYFKRIIFVAINNRRVVKIDINNNSDES